MTHDVGALSLIAYQECAISRAVAQGISTSKDNDDIDNRSICRPTE